MNHSPADIIAQRLIDAGVFDTDWPVFVNTLPMQPALAASCYDTTGQRDGRRQRTGKVATHPGVQVRVRGLSGAAAYAKIAAAVEIIDSTRRVTTTIGEDTYFIQSISRTGEPIALGETETGRWEYTLNLLATLPQMMDDSGWPGPTNGQYAPGETPTWAEREW